MSSPIRALIVNHIALPVDASYEEAFSVSASKLRRAGLLPPDASYRIFRRSVDARKKPEIRFVYSVAVEGSFPKIPESYLKSEAFTRDFSLLAEEEPIPSPGTEKISADPVVVGTGPCGLFAALLLAEAGYAPILLERGGKVEERKRAVDRFQKERILSSEDNIQFGAGGAGTFSDGKLITRVSDPLSHYVLRRFVEFGAPKEILYLAKPHIGTDILSGVVDRMLSHIESLGGKILYHTRFLRPLIGADGVYAVETSGGTLPAGALILAIGHSARDTYLSLTSSGILLLPKDFSVGVRIEHPARLIDRAMYGSDPDPRLGHAEYTLSTATKARGVYTFCMCPGGSVIAAASEEGGVVVNGMSEHKRDGENSNCAVACSVFRSDYGDTPESAIAFQRGIERAAYLAGGSDYSAPAVTVGDFLEGKLSHEPSLVKPTYMNGGIRLAMPDSYLPSFVCASIRSALSDFDRKISGFAAPYALLTGAETRTSSPIRIPRDPATRAIPGIPNFYPAGEGAGYAGGITSAAIDGIRTAFAVIRKYAPAITG